MNTLSIEHDDLVSSRHLPDMPAGRNVMLALLVAIAALFLALPIGYAQEAGRQAEIDLPVGQGQLMRFNEPVESVLLADTTIADTQIVSPTLIYVFGLKPGITNLIAVTATERIEARTQLRVSASAGPANAARRAVQPGSATHLSIFGNRIMAIGQANGVDEAMDIENVARTYAPNDEPPINDMTVRGSQQVNIRVRFAEVSRTELQSYGVDWNASISSGNFEFGLFADNGVASSGGGNLGFGGGGDSFKAEVLIEALQRNGIVKILAEPNLTAVTGQTASFLAGGEVPIPVPAADGNVTVQYKPFGVSLSFTPTLIGRERIALNVQPEVSSLSESSVSGVNGFNMPSFVVRKADTTVEIGSGQTFAIAGLFQQRMSRNLQKFPVLGDVPVLGTLFQSQRFQREETELVILITPYLVEPVGERLATPLDRPARSVTRKRVSDPAALGMIIK